MSRTHKITFKWDGCSVISKRKRMYRRHKPCSLKGISVNYKQSGAIYGEHNTTKYLSRRTLFTVHRVSILHQTLRFFRLYPVEEVWGLTVVFTGGEWGVRTGILPDTSRRYCGVYTRHAVSPTAGLVVQTTSSEGWWGQLAKCFLCDNRRVFRRPTPSLPPPQPPVSLLGSLTLVYARSGRGRTFQGSGTGTGWLGSGGGHVMTGGEQGQGRQGQGRASVAVLVTQGRGTPADPALAPVPWCLSLSVFVAACACGRQVLFVLEASVCLAASRHLWFECFLSVSPMLHALQSRKAVYFN